MQALPSLSLRLFWLLSFFAKLIREVLTLPLGSVEVKPKRGADVDATLLLHSACALWVRRLQMSLYAMGDFCAASSHSHSVSFHCGRGGQTDGLLLTHLPWLLLILLACITRRKREPVTSSWFFPIHWNSFRMIQTDVPGFQAFLPRLLYHRC